MQSVQLADWGIFPGKRPYVIAGPCSAESEVQVMETAGALHRLGVGVFRAGIWKPRTHPGNFEGVGEEALRWLRAVKDKYGMTVCCEAAVPSHVEACLKAGVDMLWIGARTTANPFMVQEIAEALKGCDLPVLVKNPVNPDVDLWMGAVERLRGCGISRIAAVHRGVSACRKLRYRNDPAWGMAIELHRRMKSLPLFCDPSHLGGSAAFVRELASTAIDLGFDGLMVEVHCHPETALSDAGQQITPDSLAELLEGERRLVARERDCPEESAGREISLLRSEIDSIDGELLALLARRRDVAERIGILKRECNVAIIQAGRWTDVLDRAVSEGRRMGLSEEFVLSVFSAIHLESIAAQRKK